MPLGLRRREPPTRLSQVLGLVSWFGVEVASAGGGVAKGDLWDSSSPLGRCIRWQEWSMSAGSTPLGSCS